MAHVQKIKLKSTKSLLKSLSVLPLCEAEHFHQALSGPMAECPSWCEGQSFTEPMHNLVSISEASPR